PGAGRGAAARAGERAQSSRERHADPDRQHGDRDAAFGRARPRSLPRSAQGYDALLRACLARPVERGFAARRDAPGDRALSNRAHGSRGHRGSGRGAQAEARAFSRYDPPRARNQFGKTRFAFYGPRIARSLVGGRETQPDQPRAGLDRARRAAGRQAAAEWIRANPSRARGHRGPRWKGEHRIPRRRTAGHVADPARGRIAVHGLTTSSRSSLKLALTLREVIRTK